MKTINTARLNGRLGMALDKALRCARNNPKDRARTARLLRACAALAARWQRCGR